MFRTAKRGSFRRKKKAKKGKRRRESSEEEEEDGGDMAGAAAPATSVVASTSDARHKKKKRRKGKRSGGGRMSFAHDLEEEEGDVPAVRVRKNVAAAAAAPARPSLATAATATPSRYSKEMLTALRSAQRTAVKRRRAPAQQNEGPLGDSDDSDRPSASLAEQARQARLQRKKVASGEFIPLVAAKDDGAGAGRVAGTSADTPADAEEARIADAWEASMVQRGGDVDKDGKLRYVAAEAPAIVPLAALRKRLQETVTRVREAVTQHERHLERLQADKERLQGEKSDKGDVAALDARATFFRGLHRYLSQLCGCLNTKVALIGELEAAIDAVCAAKVQASAKHRALGVLDDMDAAIAAGCTLVSAAGTAPPASLRAVKSDEAGDGGGGDGGGSDTTRRHDDDEAMRASRRAARAALAEALADGGGHDWSSDPLLPQRVHDTFERMLRKLLRTETLSYIFKDVKEEFSSLHNVSLRLLQWRHASPQTYTDAYCTLSLPKLLAPFMRRDLLAWLPLHLKFQTLDEFPFFATLFAFQEHDSEDMDIVKAQSAWEEADVAEEARRGAAAADDGLIPGLVKQVALPRVEAMAASMWDPFAPSQTQALLQCYEHLQEFDVPAEQLQRVLDAVTKTLHGAVESCYVPVVHTREGALAPVTMTQFALVVKLLRGAMAWNNYLPPDALFELVMRRIIVPYLLPTLSFLVSRCVAPNAAAFARALQAALAAVLGSIPSSFLSRGAAAAPLALLLQRVRAGADVPDACKALVPE